MKIPSPADAVVIGAGPVGCVAALSLARRGARVLVLEGQPRSAFRLAGEWVHPLGVDILRDLGVYESAAVGAAAGCGFQVVADDGGPPIDLPYSQGRHSLVCEHSCLVLALRDALANHPHIELVPEARVVAIQEQKVTVELARGGEFTATAPLLVGADGRNSVARRSLGLADDRLHASSMAGVILDDRESWRDGFGRVILGGPGPILGYRLNDEHIRLFLDLPARAARLPRTEKALWEAFAPHLPPELRPAFRQALSNRRTLWAANQWRTRQHFGRPGLALIGDAAGHFHPLTAMGMTLGFLDASTLAENRSFAAFHEERSRQSWVVELMTRALYRVFVGEDEMTALLRRTLYRMWREDPAERDRTLRLLAGEESHWSKFHRAFLKVMLLSLPFAFTETVTGRRWRHGFELAGGFAGWLGWLARRSLPRLFS